MVSTFANAAATAVAIKAAVTSAASCFDFFESHLSDDAFLPFCGVWTSQFGLCGTVELDALPGVFTTPQA